MVGLSSSSLSLSEHLEFHHLFRDTDEAHRLFSVVAHDARKLELDLDAAQVALATSEGKTAGARAATADA